MRFIHVFCYTLLVVIIITVTDPNDGEWFIYIYIFFLVRPYAISLIGVRSYAIPPRGSSNTISHVATPSAAKHDHFFNYFIIIILYRFHPPLHPPPTYGSYRLLSQY